MAASLTAQAQQTQRMLPVKQLPDVVLLHIAEHLLEATTAQDAWSTEPTHTSLVRMMGVCDRWHSVCAHMCFREAWLGYSEYSRHNEPARDLHEVYGLGLGNLVKRMVLYLPETMFAGGASLPDYLLFLQSISLPRVKELLVCVYQCFSYRPHDIVTTRKGVHRVANIVNMAMPNVESLAISSIEIGYSLPNSDIVPELTDALQYGKSEIHIAAPSALSLDTVAYQSAPQLTTISLGNRVLWTDSLVSAIRLNALVLETLSIASIPSVKLLQIVRGTDGAPVVYASLASLDIEVNEPKHSRDPSLSIQLAGVEFPKLRRLVCQGEYPFADDTVLLQNRACLEHLKMTVGAELYTCLTKRTIDQITGYPFLRSIDVSVSCSLRSMQDPHETGQLFQRVLRMAPKAAHIRFPESPLNASHILTRANNLSHLQRCDCPELRLAPTELLQLAERCPGLRSATFTLVPEPEAPDFNFETQALARSCIHKLQMYVQDTHPDGPHHFGRYFLWFRRLIPSLKQASMSTLDEADAQRIAEGFEEAIGQPGGSDYKYVKGLHVGIGINLF